MIKQTLPANTANVTATTESKPLPNVLKGFNFGALLCSWVWGIAHHTYWPLVIIPAYFIPGIGHIVFIGVSIALGFQGNEFAWKNRDWESIQQFKQVQRIWAYWGIGINFVIVILKLISILINMHP